jgi:hypothetical protein
MKCYVHNDVDAVGTCTSCGKSLCQDCVRTVDGRLVCKDCLPQATGHTGSPLESDRKDPLLAILLGLGGGIVSGSLFFSLGQLYNGQVKKFIVLTILNAIIGVLALAIYIIGCFTVIGICCCLPVFALPLILYIYELYDAYDTAARMNRGESIKDWLD